MVGCGGTGGFVAEGLCRLFQGRDATIVLVDHDRVEPHNLLQPEFLSRMMSGQFKSQALADRLSASLQPARGLLGLSLPGRGLPLPRPLLPRRPGHRLRRQRRRKAGHGRMLAGRPLPLAHRRWQRHQLGPSAHRQRRRAGVPGGTALRPAKPVTWPRRPRCNARTC